MKWPLSSRNKFRIAGILALVFLGVLARHFAGKNHVNELGDSFSSFYKDRLVAEGYIYELSNRVHEQKMLTDNCADQSIAVMQRRMTKLDQSINGLVVAYTDTRLTKQEAIKLDELKCNLHQLQQAGHRYLNRQKYGLETNDVQKRMHDEFYQTHVNLRELSGIQLAVGKQMHEDSQRVRSDAALFSHMELTMLIIIGLLIQFILTSTRTTVIRKPVKFWLN